MRKKLLSLALALVMCIGLTVPVMAAETQNGGFKQTTLSMLKNDFVFEGGIVRVEWERKEVNSIKDGAVTMQKTTVWEPTVYISLGSKISLASLAIDDGYKMIVFKDYNDPAIADEIASYQLDKLGNFKIGTYTKIEDYGIPLIYEMDIVVVNEPAAILKTPFLDISNFDEPYKVTALYNKTAYRPISQTLREDIEWVYERGISKGTSATTFSPFSTATRAQLLQMLWIYSGKPEPKSTDIPFEDVVETDGFYKAVCWAYETGLIKKVFFDGPLPMPGDMENGKLYPNGGCPTIHAIGALNYLFQCELPDAIQDGQITYWGTSFCLRANLAHYLHYAHQYSTEALNR